MITRALFEGLRSAISQSLTAAPDPNRLTPLSIVFVSGVAIISLILAEVFLGLSMYKGLLSTYGYSEGISMLITTCMYIVQGVLCFLIIKQHLKKIVTQNIIVKDYRLVKGVLASLIEGYKKG